MGGKGVGTTTTGTTTDNDNANDTQAPKEREEEKVGTVCTCEHVCVCLGVWVRGVICEKMCFGAVCRWRHNQHTEAPKNPHAQKHTHTHTKQRWRRQNQTLTQPACAERSGVKTTAKPVSAAAQSSLPHVLTSLMASSSSALSSSSIVCSVLPSAAVKVRFHLNPFIFKILSIH